MNEESKKTVVPEIPPATAESPIIIQIPTPAQQRKKESSGILGVILALFIILIFGVLFYRTPGSEEKLTALLDIIVPSELKSAIVSPATVTCEEGINYSIHLEFANKPIQGKDFTQTIKTPTLKESASCIYFNGSAMASMLVQEISLQSKQSDGTQKENKFTGAQIFADKISKATALELGKDIKIPADKKWTNNLYFRILPILDANNIKTTGGFSYLILSGYLISPTATPTSFQTATQTPKSFVAPTEMVLVAVDIPEETATIEMSPTPLATDTPPPTNIPRPTLEIFVTQVNEVLATQMVIYEVTPMVYPTSTDAHNVVSLDYYINNILNGRTTCSPLSANYYTRWSMDNVVTLFMNIDCADGLGPVFYVQIPTDIAARHVTDINYPQIWLSQYPAKLHGPGLDVGGGYSLQPFK